MEKPGAICHFFSCPRFQLPREDYISRNPVLKELEVFLALVEAVLDIVEIPLIVVSASEEEAGLGGEKRGCKGMVFLNPLALVNNVLNVLLVDEGKVLINHFSLVLKVGEKEIDLAVVHIILLISHLHLILEFRLQLRQVKDFLRIGINLEIVVLGDEGAEFLNESEIPLVVDVPPVIVGLESLPSLTKRLKKFLNLLTEIFLRNFINLFGEVANVIGVGLLTFKGYLCVVKINVESDSKNDFNG